MNASSRHLLNPSLWKNPPVDYRPAPFWIWNEKQEPRELKRQIREMKRQGFGGFFMHARIGLKTPYLGNEWFEHVRVSTEEAKRLGLQAWIYDEDRWPSGFAGGQTAPVAGPEYASHAMVCRQKNGRRTFEVIRGPRHLWTNNASDPDVLNPRVIAAFLKVTHEKYRQTIGAHFGKTVPGSFTDEPSFVMWGYDDKFRCIPWTGKMEAAFRQKRGYALRPHLASLFFDEGDFRRVRVDFHRTVTELFATAFAKQIYDWCDRRKLASTGHMMMEDSLLSQVQAIGAAMPHYEYFHIPGIDHLGHGMADAPLLQKQCASAARQLGQRRVLSELFGGAGWETPLHALRPAGDYDYALGVNLLNQHLAYYSIRGRRKRDYPSSCSYHQPGYDLYRPFNDYFARLSYALTQGRTVGWILVLHPISSAWTLYSPFNPQPVEKLDREFAELCANLLRIQRDYDFGDEMLMEKYARVRDGRFIIGQAGYDAVVIPPSESWSSHTLALLEQFAAQGGKILAVGRSPRFVDGRPSRRLATFLKRSVSRIAKPDRTALDRTLASVPREVKVTTADGAMVEELIYQHRVDGPYDLYFLTFGRREKPFRAHISLEGEGALERLDAADGTIRALPGRSENGRTILELDIPARGSCLISMDRRRPVRKAASLACKVQVKPLAGPWKVARLDSNVLLIDRCRVKCFQSPWSAPMGIAGGGGLVSLPNAHDLLEMSFDNNYLRPSWPVYLRFEFQADLPKGAQVPCALVIEDPKTMTEFKANGRAVAVSKTDWWLDRQFRRVDLRGTVGAGLNRIDCRVNWVRPIVPGTLQFTPDGTELESVYLIGDFNITWAGAATRLVAPKPLPSDPSTDLARHGLPFYAGTIRYEKELILPEISRGHRYILKFPRPGGEGTRLWVNGRRVRDLWCEPFEADCTAWLRRGMNRIRADLFANLGNLLGYLHHKAPWSDPAHFKSAYLLRPVGLGGCPELVVR